MTPFPHNDDDSITILSGIAGTGNSQHPDHDHDHGAGGSPIDEGSPTSVDLLKPESGDGTVATPASQKPSQDSISPAARTLYALSQNMDDLLDASDTMTQQPQQLQQPSMEAVTQTPQKAEEDNWDRQSKACQIQQPPDPQNVLQHHMYADEYTAIPLSMTSSSGGIGLVIQRASFLSNKPMTHCQVLRVVPGGVADKNGVQTNDWICHPLINADNATLVLAEFQEVQTWAKQSPFQATLLRPNQPTISEQDSQKSKNEISESSSSTKKEASCKPPRSPFCRLCNHISGTPRPSCHHSWCPLGPFFQTNGANELLERIEYGRKNNCTACQIEYAKGRLQEFNTHSKLCRDNQAKESQEIVSKGNPVPLSDISPKQPQNRRTASKSVQQQISTNGTVSENRSSKRQPKKTPKAIESRSLKSLSAVKPTPKAAPRQKKSTTAVSDKPKVKMTSKTCVPPMDDSKSLASPKKKKQRTSTTLQHDESTFKPIQINKATPTSTGTQGGAPQEQMKSFETTKPTWASVSLNPWGPQGYVEGDVLLYGPPTGIGHNDAELPSPRFTHSPFSTDSNYRNTHQTPEEGFTVLSLMRDPMAQTPWGFTVVRDEFGNACLVESVTEFSPATSAKFLGGGCKCSLEVHDMILMINGQNVCGMTEVAFQVELEASGPNVTLVVSRYRHSSNTKVQAAIEEQNMMQTLDASCMDDRIVGWHEIGIGSRYVSLQSVPWRQPPRLEVETRHDSIDDASTSRSEGTSVASMTCNSPTKMEGKTPHNAAEAELHAADSQSDWENDLNTWNGCTCGKIHQKSSQVFWLQCDACGSWFDVSSECVGFSMEEAESKEQWYCPACVGTAAQADLSRAKNKAHDACTGSATTSRHVHHAEQEETEQLSRTIPKAKTISPDTKKGGGKVDFSSIEKSGKNGREGEKVLTPPNSTSGKTGNMQPRERKERGLKIPQGKAGRRGPVTPISNQEAIRETADALHSGHKPGVVSDGHQKKNIVLQKGDLVYVEPHAWPGWNCQGGIGHVTKTTQRSDEGEDVEYDVRFVVGYSNKGIAAKFVRPYSF